MPNKLLINYVDITYVYDKLSGKEKMAPCITNIIFVLFIILNMRQIMVRYTDR